MTEQRLESAERLLHSILWQNAKAGWQSITLWAIAQFEIDGDTVQIEEILEELRQKLLDSLAS